MAYIGAEPLPGQNREVDDISSGFNGSATAFTLQVSSTNVSPESANNILINLGGVIQNPGTDYTIAASTITFTTAPAAGLSFFGLILGAGINTATVADQTIGTSKVLDNAITADKLAHTSVTAGSYTTADITVDAQGRITAAANGTIATAEIADNAVTTAKINDSAVTTAKIADDAVTAAKIADNAINSTSMISGALIGTGQITNSAVTGGKIADGTIGTSKLEDDAVTAAKLADNAVVRANISDDAVNADKITAGGVDTTALGSDSVTTVKILNANVTTDKLADNAVTSQKIANNAITTAKINNDSVTADKLFNLANNTVFGRIASGTGSGTTLTPAQIRTMINVADGATAGGGKILQVKQGALNGTFSTTSTSFVNIGLSEAITPSATTSKILVIAMLNMGSDNNGNRIIIRLVRTGDDNILVGNASGSRTRGSAQYAATDDGDQANFNLTHLDSPNTTSSTTYQVQCKVQSSSGTAKFGASGGDGNSSIEARTPQRIVLLEVSA